MAENDVERARLIESINAEGIAEAERVRALTAQAIDGLERDHAARLTTIANSEEARAREQIALISKRSSVAKSVAERRSRLAVTKRAVEAIIEQATEKLIGMRGTSAYWDALVAWTVEAIAGLGASDVAIETSPEDREAAESRIAIIKAEVLRVTGRHVSVVSVEGTIIGGPGVIVREGNNNRVYDNRIATRMARYRSGILKIVQSEMYRE